MHKYTNITNGFAKRTSATAGKIKRCSKSYDWKQKEKQCNEDDNTLRGSSYIIFHECFLTPQKSENSWQFFMSKELQDKKPFSKNEK